MNEKIETFYTKENWDYELLDTGDGEKLERFGRYSFIRPYEDAVWSKTFKKEWVDSDGKFITSKSGEKAGWKIKKGIDEKWVMSYKDIKFLVAPTPFRHFGFFPEQASHWDFIESKIKNSPLEEYPKGEVENASTPSLRATPQDGNKIKFLNLFGYTGVASLFALRAGAEVTHLDASKQSLTIAKENQKLSELDELPMRIICDDVLKFLEKEAKRGNKYDCVIMDPPKHGRGPNGEVWKIEEQLPKLLMGVKKILSDKPLFVILTSYATDSSAFSLGYALAEKMKDFDGKIIQGELCIKEKAQDRFISLANTAIWQSK